MTPALPFLVPALLLSGAALAQDKPVYKCVGGGTVLYTDQLSPQEARDRGCTTIEGAPVTVIQAPRRPAAPAVVAAGTANPAATAAASAARPADQRVDAAAQRARDTDARRILAEELRREEERLTTLQREFNNGEPERRGDERNYQRYLDRVAEMKAGIARKQADIEAIRRELAKLGG